VNQALPQARGDIADVRTLKLVAVGDRQQPPRLVHVVDISADLDAPEGVTAYCGAHFTPRRLVEVPWMTMEPHELCRRRSSLPRGANSPRTGSGAKAEIVVDDADNRSDMFRDSSVNMRVTAQWSVADPVIYVQHAVASDWIDIAVSGAGEHEVIAGFQLNNPLDALTAGHNLIDAGLSLAKTLGVDLDQLKAATPSTWWAQSPLQPDTNVTEDESADS
jgi:hypothetical protein